MHENRLEAVPPEQRDKVRSAMIAAFGSGSIDAIVPITGGASSASTYRLEIGLRRYLLRVEGEPSPLRNPHQYVSMQIAAEAGITPKIRYLDESARVAVVDFVPQLPLQAYPGGPRALAQALGEMLSRVQSTRAFPHFVNYPDMVARLFAHVRRTGLFRDGLLEPYVERLELLRQAYDSGLKRMVSSHNDPIPSNILFDGQRLWLIDWESAYCNDPLVDVAIVLDSSPLSAELDDVLLEAWLGRAPAEAIRTRLELTRALTRLYYAGVLLSASAAGRWIMGDGDVSAPPLDVFRQMIHAGRLKAGAPETKHILGKLFLESFLSGASPPGFDAAV